MSKYLDTEKLLDYLEEFCKPILSDYDITNAENLNIQEIQYNAAKEIYDDIYENILGCDCVEVAPVVHGHWIRDYHENNEKTICFVCSNCNIRISATYPPGKCECECGLDFCPYCGAKMNERENNEDDR